MADEGKKVRTSSDQEPELEQLIVGGVSSEARSEHGREEGDGEGAESATGDAMVTDPTDPSDNDNDNGNGDGDGNDETGGDGGEASGHNENGGMRKVLMDKRYLL